MHNTMVLSQYAVLFVRKNKYYAFSTLSKTLLELDKETYAILSAGCFNLDDIKGVLNKDNINYLFDTHILCYNKQDEYLFCKSMILTRRNDETDMHLTIAPTMDCCFSCFYCFEKNKKPVYMPFSTIDAIINLINSFKNLKSLHVTWFGGEPLMAIDVIQYFTDNFITTFKGKYSADIITTAYHINEITINVLKKACITEMQVSIDGNEKTHNSVKYTSTKENSFRRIMENILFLSEGYPSLTIGIRVNLTKQNYKEYPDLYHELSNRFVGRNISIFPGFVENRNNGIDKSCLFSKNEVSLFSLELWKSYKIPTPWILYQKCQSECAIRKKNSFVIDASGNVYKCWEKIGDVKFKIGDLSKKGKIININQIRLQRYLYGADILDDEKCRKCSILPICFGGCPLLRLENTFENKENILCSSYKGRIIQWLSAYIELKENLNENANESIQVTKQEYHTRE